MTIPASIPKNEEQRLKDLLSYNVLDTEAEKCFDDLTALAAQISGVPISLVSLIDGKRQWFKSHHGLNATETPRELAFCAHAILNPEEIFQVPDALLDERFKDNPLVTGEPVVRFYAGAPLLTENGTALGTLCVIDHQPKELTEGQLRALKILSQQVVAQLELRKKIGELEESHKKLGEANECLKVSNQELEQFAYVASHDLQEPLRTVGSFAQLLGQRYQNQFDEKGQQWLNFITEGASRMQNLVRDLLVFSKLGKHELNLVPVDTKELVEGIILDLNSSIKEKNAKVVVDNLPICNCDQAQIRLLFQNLISNAIKFHKPGHAPVVRISAQANTDEVVFAIADNGIGIETEFFDSVFIIFQCLNSKSDYVGNGLGLANCKKIVERHRGRLWIDSKLGEGSIFYFALKRT